MIMILMKRSFFLIGGGDSENAVAYPVLHCSGSGIHYYLRDESGEEVLEEEEEGYLLRGVVLRGRYSRS